MTAGRVWSNELLASGVPAELVRPETVAAEFREESFCEVTIFAAEPSEAGNTACEKDVSTGDIVPEETGEIVPEENMPVGGEDSIPPVPLLTPFAPAGATLISDVAVDSADCSSDVLTTCGAIAGTNTPVTSKIPDDIAGASGRFASDNCFLPPALLGAI